MAEQTNLLEEWNPRLYKAIRRIISIFIGLLGILLLKVGYASNDMQPIVLVMGAFLVITAAYGVLKPLASAPKGDTINE